MSQSEASGPPLRYTNETARELAASVAAFTKATNDDLYDLLKWIERLRSALREIRDLDPVDAALDPKWAARVAREALERG